jgi:hypothetical protein
MSDAPETTAPSDETRPATLNEVPVLLFIRGLAFLSDG